VHLASIHIYPLKAARAVDLEESFVEPCGLADDRRWLLVDEEGRFISQREEPSLARVVVTCGPGHIRVSADGRTGLVIAEPPPAAALIKVRVWSDALLATAAGPEADAWFSAFLGRRVGLVHLDDPTRRPVDPQYGRAGDIVSFADGFPLLLTSTGSLGELGAWLAADRQAPAPMTRFRPSVVVSGAPPWAEDRWRRIRIGAIPFRVAKPCGRCVVTTTDQITGQRGQQPLKMLGRRRRFGNELVFGQNLIPDSGGVIRVGDPVEILDAA
jgi:MOSC domain-containing protein